MPAGSKTQKTHNQVTPYPAADLFALLWNTLSNILGTGATAALIARALRGALPSTPALADVSIATRRFTYGYQLPDSWRSPDNAEATAAVNQLMMELVPLLTALTGRVVVRQLARLEALGLNRLLVKQEPPQ
jgi:hypothetical protein